MFFLFGKIDVIIIIFSLLLCHSIFCLIFKPRPFSFIFIFHLLPVSILFRRNITRSGFFFHRPETPTNLRLILFLNLPNSFLLFLFIQLLLFCEHLFHIIRHLLLQIVVFLLQLFLFLLDNSSPIGIFFPDFSNEFQMSLVHPSDLLFLPFPGILQG